MYIPIISLLCVLFFNTSLMTMESTQRIFSQIEEIVKKEVESVPTTLLSIARAPETPYLAAAGVSIVVFGCVWYQYRCYDRFQRGLDAWNNERR